MTSTDSVYSSIQSHDGEIPQPGGRWKLFLYSAIGAFVFFLPVTYQDKRSIPLDHLVTMVREGIPAAVPWIVLPWPCTERREVLLPAHLKKARFRQSLQCSILSVR